MLGKNLTIAIDKDKGSSNGPKVAARMETDPGKAEEVVDKLLNLLRTRTRMNPPIQKAKDDDTLVIATDQGYADQVLKGGNLGETEKFKQAVPDTKNAVLAGYVDFEAAAAGSLTGKANSDKDFAALRSAGFSTRITGDGEADFTSASWPSSPTGRARLRPGPFRLAGSRGRCRKSWDGFYLRVSAHFLRSTR